MKGYCVDVSEFTLQKKEMVVDAIKILTGCEVELSASPGQKRIGNVTGRGQVLGKIMWGAKMPNANQSRYLISFSNLMLEAGFNYEEHGVKDFKCIDWSERAVTENKPASNKTRTPIAGDVDDIFKEVKITTNKTRPLITREQYDAVMAQSDKRTFTKALDDLLAIEKEQLLDESAVRIEGLEVTNDFLNKVVDSWRESWERAHNSKVELKAKMEWQERKYSFIVFVLLMLLASQVAITFSQ